MTKSAEANYFKAIGPAGLEFTLQKPFIDRPNTGVLLHNIAAIFTVITNNYKNENIKIIDIGCGSGWTSYFLAKAGYEVLGIDISKDAIQAASKRFGTELSNLSFKVADFEKMPSDISGYDVAVFIDSLHHADNQFAALKSVYKILNAGGICVICEPGKGHGQAADALKAKESYGVNENDVVPKNITQLSKLVGFIKSEVFAHPSLVHKVIYKKLPVSSLRTNLLNNRIIRAAATFYVLTFKKSSEGLIVLHK